MAEFIGSKKVKKKVEDDGYLTVILKDESSFKVKKEVYDKIVLEEEGNGDYNDVLRHYFAMKYIADLSENGQPLHMAEAVAQGLMNLGINCRDRAIAKKFGVNAVYEIPLSDIVNEVSGVGKL